MQLALKPEAKKNRNLSGTTMWKHPPAVDEQRITEHATSGQTFETEGGIGESVGRNDQEFNQSANTAQKPSQSFTDTDTEQAYGGRSAYDKAKAEGKTKLNYQQWVQVRTRTRTRAYWSANHFFWMKHPGHDAGFFIACYLWQVTKFPRCQVASTGNPHFR